MKQKLLIGFLGMTAVGLVGCSTVAPQPGADTIKVTQRAVPTGCQFMGNLSNEDTNGATHSYTSHAHLEVDQLNTLKNDALKRGANVLMLTQHQTTYVNQRQSDNGRMPAFTGVGTHAMAAKAYRCDAKALQQVKVKTDISDIKSKDE